MVVRPWRSGAWDRNWYRHDRTDQWKYPSCILRGVLLLHEPLLRDALLHEPLLHEPLLREPLLREIPLRVPLREPLLHSQPVYSNTSLIF